MTVASLPSVAPSCAAGQHPPLEMGDRLDQATFHARYETMPPQFRAELIGGMVYVPSPAKPDHGRTQLHVAGWAAVYEANTPHVCAYDNATQILGADSEPQPDVTILIEGGRTRIGAGGYLEGPPEFVAEVALSSASYDLHSKKHDYERYGVGEYLVVLPREARVVWFVRPGGLASPFVELAPDPDGLLRSPTLPGLWLDGAALLRGELSRVLEVLNAGLASPAHSAFISARKTGT